MADIETKVSEKSQENCVKDNRVYILGPFDRSISSGVVPDLVELIEAAKFAKDPVIEIYVNSVGGIAAECMSLISLIDRAKASKIRIETYNLGIAYSCGSILSVMGDVKYMSKYAFNMPHLGQAFLCPTTVEQLDRGISHVSQWFTMLKEIYLRHTKIPKKKLEEIMKDDSYVMNAKECLQYGFCDVVF